MTMTITHFGPDLQHRTGLSAVITVHHRGRTFVRGVRPGEKVTPEDVRREIRALRVRPRKKARMQVTTHRGAHA